MQKEPPKSPKRQYDDPELNDILMKLALDPTVTMLVTLDKSQAGGKHEKALLDLNRKHNLALFNTHVATRSHTPVREFAIGQSATHQISHTKGFVADGKVAGEGSTNWSIAGEGEFVVAGKPGGAGFKAQNNTQSIITDPDGAHDRASAEPGGEIEALTPRVRSPNDFLAAEVLR